MDEPDWDDDHDGPSKSAVKREMIALQDLGTRLTELPENQLSKIPIDSEQLYDAIMLARRIKKHGGRRRQLQFIGKLMRNIDPTPIEDALAALDGRHQAENARFHRLEQLRDDLLSQGDRGLDSVISVFPTADRQQLRQYIRMHATEEKNDKPRSARKKLFRYLRALDEASSPEDSGASPPDVEDPSSDSDEVSVGN